MMKAKMFVVNENTLSEAIKTGIAKIKVPLAKKDDEDEEECGSKKPSVHFVQSTDSMLADLLQVNLGDYVFFWCEKKNNAQRSTIFGVYRVISKPFFKFDDNDDLYPFKVFIEPAYLFDRPITEYNVLNSPFIKDSLWNIVGKKICGKGRGSIQITPREAESLIQLLISENQNFDPSTDFIPPDRNRFINLPCSKGGIDYPAALEIDYSMKGNKLEKPPVNHIYEYDMYSFCHFKPRGKLHFEKSFEAIFNYEINRHNSQFFEPLGIKEDRIIWFGNYLPYSLDATEMDYLIFESIDGETITNAFVVEFKLGKLPLPDEDTHFYRAIQYSKWINENLLNGAHITQPILICENCPDFHTPPENPDDEELIRCYNQLEERCEDYLVKKIKIFVSDFSKSQPKFIRKK